MSALGEVPAEGPAERIVVIGASAGGVEALVDLVGALPAGFEPAVLVVLHISPTSTSVLPSILRRATRLLVESPASGDEICGGRVYVAPPDHHLVVEGCRLALTQTPRENGHRPAIDVTMRTAAQCFDGRTVGVILSGARDDGTAGLAAIKQAGGLACAQDPHEALYDGMPRSAIEHVEIDAVLPLRGLADFLVRAEELVSSAPASTVADGQRVLNPAGVSTRYTCPDCGGVLFEEEVGALPRFRCSVGHVFSIESLASAQVDQLESALWAAVRTLEDRAALLLRLAERSRDAGSGRAISVFERQAADANERASIIRAVIVNPSAEAEPPPEEPAPQAA